ncbi:MAG: bifunctional metallophosphatase/5'-nucleotidase [Enterovibrio sp.]
MKLKAVVGLFLLASSYPVLAVDGDIREISILGTSDLHGHFVPWDYAADQANLAGSLSQIATKIHEIRQSLPNVILVDAGDTTQGNFVETFKNEPISPMMLGFNALNYDVWVLGNHEFDFGLPVLKTSLDQFKGQSLGGNIKRADGNPFLPAYTIIERQGVTIAVIGMDTPMTAQFAKGSNRLGGVTFTNPTQEVKKTIAKIKDQVDAIVLVAHMGLDNENDLADTGVTDIAKGNPELAAIVAGHMHVQVDKAIVNGVIITEPDKYGRALSRIDLKFEKKNGKYILIDKDSYTYKIADLASDKHIESLYAPYHKKLRANANRVLAQLTGSNLVPQDEVKGIPQVQVQDSGISALFQEAAFYYAPKANVIALGIDNDKARLDVGPIKAKDIAYNYQYASGEITVYQMTGADLKAYMEWVADYFNLVQDGDVTYSFNPARRSSKYSTNDFFAGVTYTIDLRNPVGERITNLKLADGSVVKADTEIRLGMNSYRMGHLTKKGGPLQDKSFPVIFDTKSEFGEEQGTIRNLTIRYLEEVTKGQYQGKPQQRWSLQGLSGYERERKIVHELLNTGKIKVPSLENGRYTNTASINVKPYLFADAKAKDAALQELQTQLKSMKNEADKQAIEEKILLINALN